MPSRWRLPLEQAPRAGATRGLSLAGLDSVWQEVRVFWETAVEREPDPANWIKSIGKASLEARASARIVLVDLWIQALTVAADHPEIRRALRRQVCEVHEFVASLIRRAQEEGGILPDRDPDAEAWIFISLGLLSTIDHRLGNVVGDEFEDIVASRRAWMTGRID